MSRHNNGGKRCVYLVCLLGVLLLLAGVRAGASVYYVTPNGNDNNSGTSWAKAKATVSAAMGLATSGDQIWVAAGYYNSGQITMKTGVGLYGGFSGSETHLGQRDWVHNVTTLDGGGSGYVINNPGSTSISTQVDGFTMKDAGVNFAVYTDGSMTIANNTLLGAGIATGAPSARIMGNTIQGSSGYGISAGGGTALIVGNVVTNCTDGGMYINFSGLTPACQISSNVVDGNLGVGIVVLGSLPTVVSQNMIARNLAGGVLVDEASSALIADNYVLQNTSNQNGIGGGVSVVNEISNASITIKDNLIVANSAPYGGGIYIQDVNINSAPPSTSVTLANNTLVDNSADFPAGGGGIYLLNGSAPGLSTLNIANNLVAFNSSGIDDASGFLAPTFFSNDVYGSTYNNYDGIAPGATDISVDPLFLDAVNGDYHLTSMSPCIDTGMDSFVSVGDTDLDGNSRLYGAHVDIGAYEWTPAISPELASLAVSPDTVLSGQSAIVQVSLTGPAPPSGATILLFNSNPAVVSVPPSVKVPAGTLGTFFNVTTSAVASSQTATITASYHGITQSVTLTANPPLGSLTLSPSVAAGVTTVTGTITFNGPAPAGTSLTLSSSDPSVTVPSTLNVPAGVASITFNATTSAVAAPILVTISVTNGVQTLTASFIEDPAATLKNLAVAPLAVTGGFYSVGVVTLTVAAPAGGIVIPITSNNPSVAGAPAFVTVTGGKRSASFLINTTPVAAKSTATFSATIGFVTKPATLTVVPNTIASLTLLPPIVQGGENSIGIVTLSLPATAPLTVTLAGNATASPDVATVTIPTGALEGVFNISTVAVTAQTTVTIKATLYGVTKTQKLTVTP